MSRADNTGSGLILASSPTAKKKYGISNVSRPRDLPQPFPKTLHVVPPRMNLYIKRNMQVNNIFRRYVADEDLLIYSIDESILKVTRSLNLFTTEGTRSQRRKKLAQMIQEHIKDELGLIATVGIGDNPLLAKLALNNEAKHNEGFIAEWTYETVPEKVWNIPEMTDFWGIGSRMKKRLNQMGILSIRDLANWNPYTIKNRLGVIGLQLYFHANGIDRTDIAIPPEPTKEKSYGNSQVLPRDYTRGPERLVGICIDKGYKFPLNQCFKAYLFFIFNSLKCLGIDNKSNLYSPRKVICSQLIGDTCFIYLVTSGSILTR